MPRIRKLVANLVTLLSLAFVVAPGAAQAEKRIALVIGNAGYQAGALNTPANDAGLIAQTLQAAGFDVVGARDLDQDMLRHAFRDFVEKATASGPDTVAFIYVSGTPKSFPERSKGGIAGNAQSERNSSRLRAASR
jgi:Caspase domain